MKTYYSYEDAGLMAERSRQDQPCPIFEYVSGSDIVAWYGRIESQLVSKIEKEEGNRNMAYADKLRAFLKLWRENEIRGSVNREPIDSLKAAADILAVDDWDLSSYFRSLRDSLRGLIARIEELPYDDMAGPEGAPEDPMPRGGGMPGRFGPEKEDPTGQDPSGEAGGPRDEFDLDAAVDAAANDNKKPNPTEPA